MSKTATRQPVFARRLAEARRRADLTQKELGVLAGMEPEVASPRINQYERGKHEPSLETAKTLADALKIPPAFLYTDDELLARLLLQWNSLTVRQRKALVEQVEPPRPAAKRQPTGSARPAAPRRTAAPRTTGAARAPVPRTRKKPR